MNNEEFVQQLVDYLDNLPVPTPININTYLGKTDKQIRHKSTNRYRFQVKNNFFSIAFVYRDENTFLYVYSGDEKIAKKELVLQDNLLEVGDDFILKDNLVASRVRDYKKKIENKGFDVNKNIISQVNKNNPDWNSFLLELLDWAEKVNELKLDEKTVFPAPTEIILPKSPLNQILYGPPGTGKTYNTINEAVKIVATEAYDQIMNNEDLDNEQKRKKVQEKYNIFSKKDLLSKGLFSVLSETEKLELDDAQIQFVTFHQNYTYEDFIFGLKPDLQQNNHLAFKENNGIFYKICQAAYREAKFETKFQRLFEKVINKNGTVIFPLKNGGAFEVYRIKDNDNTIVFKNSKGVDEDITISSLRNYFLDPKSEITPGLKPYYQPILEKLRKLEINYVLIIDEINRANISRVFGELITLLEDDKRIGQANELIVTLPNGKPFGVPSNLYIIGTMNTADKSIALLDIALRRRFKFESKFPKKEPIEDFYEDKPEGNEVINFMTSVNNKIIEKKSSDFLIGHAFFLKNRPIKETIEHFIIPLLMEYFNNRTEDVEEILKTTNYKYKYDKVKTYKWVLPEADEKNA